jgi:hypothetical protein
MASLWDFLLACDPIIWRISQKAACDHFDRNLIIFLSYPLILVRAKDKRFFISYFIILVF